MNAAAVVTRFAPSPSGELHLGNVRTALFNLLLARRLAGRFLLRIEDTDAARTAEAHVGALERDLTWLGLEWDEGPRRDGGAGPYRQFPRGGIFAPPPARLRPQSAPYLALVPLHGLALHPPPTPPPLPP